MALISALPNGMGVKLRHRGPSDRLANPSHPNLGRNGEEAPLTVQARREWAHGIEFR